MARVWCPRCFKMYNTTTGHDCPGVFAVDEAWKKLENWLGEFTIYNPKE